MRNALLLSLLALSQPLAAQTARGGWGDELAPVVIPERLIAIGPRLNEPIEWPAPPLRRPPAPVRALYVNAWAFGGSRFRELLSLADTTEINSLVIDVKDDTGYLTYRSEVPTAIAIGANSQLRAKDTAKRLHQLHLRGIHPIARIVVAKDPLLASRKANWSVQHRDGGLWRDRLDFAWVDAYNDSIWIYAAELAAEAVHMGFGEIQFDYVRFPDEPRARMATAVFPSRKAGESTRDGVRRGLAILRERVRPLGVPYTIDVFGMTTNVEVDMGVGQVWEDLVASADVVLPMVYPSHYYHAMYGVSRPNSDPYRIVRGALEDGLRRSNRLATQTAEIRPYLQAFTLGAPRYTPEHVREQIRAAKDVGIHGWVLWNPRSAYDPRIFTSHAPVRLARSAAGTASASSPDHEVRR